MKICVEEVPIFKCFNLENLPALMLSSRIIRFENRIGNCCCAALCCSDVTPCCWCYPHIVIIVLLLNGRWGSGMRCWIKVSFCGKWIGDLNSTIVWRWDVCVGRSSADSLSFSHCPPELPLALVGFLGKLHLGCFLHSSSARSFMIIATTVYRDPPWTETPHHIPTHMLTQTAPSLPSPHTHTHTFT